MVGVDGSVALGEGGEQLLFSVGSFQGLCSLILVRFHLGAVCNCLPTWNLRNDGGKVKTTTLYQSRSQDSGEREGQSKGTTKYLQCILIIVCTKKFPSMVLLGLKCAERDSNGGIIVRLLGGTDAYQEREGHRATWFI